MPPKRKRDEFEADDGREAFRNRGDLAMFRSEKRWDFALTVDGERLLLHKQLLFSRVGKFRQLLTGGRNGLPKDDKGRTEYTEKDHDARSVRLMVDFVYGEWKAEILEFQTENQPVIQDCILLFRLGHSFDIPRMAAYAVRHLEMYLSRKLRDICVYPLHRALQAAGRKEFIEDLEAGIWQADAARHGPVETQPWCMLVDFVVVAGPVLLREPNFHLRVDVDVLPPAFVKETLLGLHAPKYQTPWMRGLRVRPARLSRPVPKKRGGCSCCGVGILREEAAVFNPWSYQMLAQRFPQLCCEACAERMDQGDGNGVVWGIFDDVKDE
ncbi:hypothetical protein KVR01_011965 [Diaporthe batatas]|uniref:uncharacterized protein n=1 Tax=Diaporthe batatas TaxID=748121 RepID=UPI001D03DE06|nr:uncharacterized protein KVR01_011965 [Diaporthe batatas]KAG8158204.1 hypothetical protein KVR01_011965 [Diaporthe batatas]